MAVRPFLAKYRARFLNAIGGNELKEGSGRARHNIIEFETIEMAREAYACAEYQAMIPLRQAGAHADFVIVEGVGE